MDFNLARKRDFGILIIREIHFKAGFHPSVNQLERVVHIIHFVMSTWTVADEEAYILDVLRRYDPKVVSLVERCHHCRLHDASSKNVCLPIYRYFQYSATFNVMANV